MLCLPATYLCGDPVATTEYVVRFAELERVFYTTKRIAEEEDLCRCPREIFIQGHGDEPYLLGDNVGKSGKVWIAKRKDEQIYVKYMSSTKPENPVILVGSRRMLLREKFVLSLYKNSDIVPQFLTVVDPPQSVGNQAARCLDYVVAMESVGSHNLNQFISGGARMNLVTLVEIAISLVQILSEFHSRGFVHGKIHAANLVFSNAEKIAQTLTLVDLEKSVPFISGNNRRHVAESFFKHTRDYIRPGDAVYRSIFELEKSVASLSRRDDWFMMSEMLLQLFHVSVMGRKLSALSFHHVTVKVTDVIARRLDPEYSDAPIVLLDMFEYSKSLTFAEKPDYDYWARRLVRSQTIGRPVARDELVGVRLHYVKNYIDETDLIEGMMTENPTVLKCPPQSMDIVERPGSGPFELKGGKLSDNVWSAIRRTGEGLEGVIVKFTKKYWREKFVSEIFSDSSITPAVYSMKESSSTCAARLIIMETVGSIDLEEYRMSRQYMSRKLAGEIAIRGIEILRQFHSRGFVHGDIHMGNFSFKKSKGKDFVDSMRLIDLDRSVPFVDPVAKRHVRQRAYIPRDEKAHLTRLNKSMLSVYELKSFPNVRLSRRDDWFRFAEMMINVLILDNDLFKKIKLLSVRGGFLSPLSVGNILVAKRERELEDVPSVFDEFYKTAMELEFNQRPPYEEWMFKFTEYVQRLDE